MQSMKRIKNVAIAALSVGVIALGAAHIQQGEALDEYKRVYDGLDIYEDGSWDYREGVEEYWFWNWDVKYVGMEDE